MYANLVVLYAPDHCSISDLSFLSIYLSIMVCSIQLCTTWTQCSGTSHDRRKYQLWLPPLAIRDLHQFNPCTSTRYDLYPLGIIVNYLQGSGFYFFQSLQMMGGIKSGETWVIFFVCGLLGNSNRGLVARWCLIRTTRFCTLNQLHVWVYGWRWKMPLKKMVVSGLFPSPTKVTFEHLSFFKFSGFYGTGYECCSFNLRGTLHLSLRACDPLNSEIVGGKCWDRPTSIQTSLVIWWKWWINLHGIPRGM